MGYRDKPASTSSNPNSVRCVAILDADAGEAGEWKTTESTTFVSPYAHGPASCIRDDFREILTGKTMKNRYRRMWYCLLYTSDAADE